MQKLATLHPGVLFLVFVGPLLASPLWMNWMLSSDVVPAFIGMLVSTFVFTVLLLAWIYAVGTTSHRALVALGEATVGLRFLRLNLGFVLVYLAVMGLVSATYLRLATGGPDDKVLVLDPDVVPMLGTLMVVAHLYSMFAMVYATWFAAKALVRVEAASQGRIPNLAEITGTFVMVWFFPIGVWFVQPRMRELVRLSGVAVQKLSD